MEFTELADYSLPAGDVTEWWPSAGRGGCWTPDQRPLTHLHEEHCARAVTDREAEPSWLGAVFEVPERFDSVALRGALRAWMRRHEAFLTTVVDQAGPDSERRLTRLSCRSESVDMEARPVGYMRTGVRVHQHLTELFETRLSPLAWPHLLVATVTGPADSFVLVFGADHSVMDAYSLAVAIGEIQRLYAAELHGRPADLAPVGSHVDHSAAERVLADALDREHRAVGEWRSFFDASGGAFPPFPLETGSENLTRSHHRQGGLSQWVLDERQASAVHRQCRTTGHSMQSAVVAALADAGRSLAGEQVLRFAMPMHTRLTPEHAAAMGWYVGMTPVEVDVTEARSAEELLTAAEDAVSATKDLVRYPFPRIAELLDGAGSPRFVVSYVDTRFVPDSDSWSRWHARTLRSRASSDQEVYFWIVRSLDGLTISARYPGNPVATANVERYVREFGSALISLASTPTVRAADTATLNIHSQHEAVA